MDACVGYALFPCVLDTSDEWRDGLVLSTENVGSREDDDGSFYFGDYTFDLGRTATHEVGHWLNLYHIWGDGVYDSCDETDEVDDTPPSYAANYGCADNSTNSCTSIDPEKGRDLRDMYENYMDYGDDECIFLFTEEQVWRMRSVLSGDGCRKEMYYAGAQLEAGQTLQPSSQRVTSVSYGCNDGCVIPEEWLNDYYCDCSQCEDEAYWTCGTCSSEGCPEVCGEFVQCDGSGTETVDTTQSVHVTDGMDSIDATDGTDSSGVKNYCSSCGLLSTILIVHAVTRLFCVS